MSGPATLIFNATKSEAFGGATITSYSWSWGDLTPDDSGPSQTHTFNAVASTTKYTVTLTVTDSAGRTSSTQQVVQINP